MDSLSSKPDLPLPVIPAQSFYLIRHGQTVMNAKRLTCGGGVDTLGQPATRRHIQSSFIVFVNLVLNAPYFLLGIASQRNLRYNVPNR